MERKKNKDLEVGIQPASPESRRDLLKTLAAESGVWVDPWSAVLYVVQTELHGNIRWEAGRKRR